MPTNSLTERLMHMAHKIENKSKSGLDSTGFPEDVYVTFFDYPVVTLYLPQKTLSLYFHTPKHDALMGSPRPIKVLTESRTSAISLQL